VLQAVIGPRTLDSLPLPRESWQAKHPISLSVGDKVICGENLYDMRDFFERYSRWEDEVRPDWNSYIPPPSCFTILNGEIGIVTDILPDGGIEIELHDRVVQMPSSYRDYNARYNNLFNRDPRKKIDLAYAITTHKMQGSECSQVVYLMNRLIKWALNRNNIYTAITRARDGVILITDSQSLQYCVRYTSAQKEKNRRVQKEQKGFKVGDVD
jgi:ATP-dependent exoDNAse (exonuclease V) alpha subunit